MNKSLSNQCVYQIIDKNNKNLSDMTDTIKQVADIEQLVQPEDSWTQVVIAELLEDRFSHLSVAIYSDGLMSLDNVNQQMVVAYCLYNVVFEQAEILRIGTYPNYQRQGIAKRLLMQTLQDIKEQEAESVSLEVRANNHRAIALYQQLGFEQINRRIGYYQTIGCIGTDGCHDSQMNQSVDALIMQYLF